jgi:two-component system, NarL family, nitrate/nitrite response regulator NarL
MNERAVNEIRLIVVDDHGLFREGLVRLLAAEPDFRVVAKCARLPEAIGVLDREPIDIVLLDFDLETEQGSRLLEEIRHRDMPTRTLMVTAGMSSTCMLDILHQGAAGIFLKYSDPSQLIQAIRTVMEGRMWLDPRAVKPVIDGALRTTSQNTSRSSLTSREKDVLRGVLEGASNKMIADRLHVSESSVKATLQHLFTKTGVRTRGQLVRIALEEHSHDWLSDDAKTA